MSEYIPDFQSWYRNEYLNCESWKLHRKRILVRDEYHCQLCGKPATDVHHWSYRNLFAPELISREDDEDLISLCRECHSKLHLLHDGDGVTHRALAEVYKSNLDETIADLTDAANEAVYKSCMPIILDRWETFEQFAGQVLAAVYEYAPLEAGKKLFGKICEYFGFTELVSAFNANTGRIELPKLDYTFGKATVASIWKTTNRKRGKTPKTLAEWHDGFNELKEEIMNALEGNDLRPADHEEEQPAHREDGNANDDPAESAVQGL